MSSEEINKGLLYTEFHSKRCDCVLKLVPKSFEFQNFNWKAFCPCIYIFLSNRYNNNSGLYLVFQICNVALRWSGSVSNRLNLKKFVSLALVGRFNLGERIAWLSFCSLSWKREQRLSCSQIVKKVNRSHKIYTS